MTRNRKFYVKIFWLLLGLSAIWLRNFFSPGDFENWYSRGVFPIVRSGMDSLIGWLPFAAVYPAFFILVFLLVYKVIRFFKNKKPWPRKVLSALLSLLAFAGGVIFFFLLLWGYNYLRQPLEQNLGLVPEPLSIADLREELDSVTVEAVKLRAQLPGIADSTVPASLLPKDLENTMRRELVKTLGNYGYPTQGKVRARLLYPKGLLLRISTAGVYIPFTGEGHVDPGLHHLQLPFVMVHEMSHGYGFGDEGTCNFLAYISCKQSDNPYLRYVGELYYWRYVASDYRDYQPEEYEKFRETIPEGLRNDLISIRQEMEKYPDMMPVVKDAAYTAYLQSQGISEGLKNYDRVIMLVHAWRKRS